MADQKLTALTELTALDPTDLAYIVDDVGGVPTSKKIEWGTVLGGSENIGGNLVRNSPGQIVTDGAEPQWWDESSGNATMTDEDAAGEGVEEKQERVFKVVTIANDEYGLQTLTFADEDLLDAGETVVSFGCWIWCASATKASIGLYGTNLTLQESGQHTGGSSWEYFAVENITLNAADANIELRLIVDTGTAYYCMPMLCVGPVARPWVGRGINHIPSQQVTHLDLNTTGDVAWSDTDCTANTDPLAVAMQLRLYVVEADGTVGSLAAVGHDSALTGADGAMVYVRSNVIGQGWDDSQAFVRCDDAQVVRYTVNEQDADNDVRVIFYLYGYWRWA